MSISEAIGTARSVAAAMQPERAALTGERARVMRQLKEGRRSRLRFSHNYEADWRGERTQPAGTKCKIVVPAAVVAALAA